mgnify:CR=1 FL=1
MLKKKIIIIIIINNNNNISKQINKHANFFRREEGWRRGKLIFFFFETYFPSEIIRNLISFFYLHVLKSFPSPIKINKIKIKKFYSRTFSPLFPFPLPPSSFPPPKKKITRKKIDCRNLKVLRSFFFQFGKNKYYLGSAGGAGGGWEREGKVKEMKDVNDQSILKIFLLYINIIPYKTHRRVTLGECLFE